MNDLIATKLKSLKLSGISKTFDIRNDEAIKEGLSYVEFFELLLNDETANRVTNARAKKMHNAKFPNHKTIEEYNFNYQPNLNKDIGVLLIFLILSIILNVVLKGPINKILSKFTHKMGESRLTEH